MLNSLCDGSLGRNQLDCTIPKSLLYDPTILVSPQGYYMRGFVQVYTGEGKGKTTAAFGLTFRAAGRGLKVYIAQFLKKGDFGEVIALRRFSDLVTIEQFGLGRFTDGKPVQEDIDAAQEGLERVKTIMASNAHDIIILEEANVAAKYGCISVSDLVRLIERKPSEMELVITGRGAAQEIIDHADLVTEMKAIKHYYKKGVTARIGIEK